MMGISVCRHMFSEREKPLHMCAAALKINMIPGLLQCLGYVAGANATGARLDGHNAAVVLNGSDLLQVRIPYGTGFVVRMAHIITEAGTFSTDITFS